MESKSFLNLSMSETKPLDIVICMGSSCFSRGNSRNLELIQSFLSSRNVPSTVQLSGHLCEGRCKDGPNVSMNGKIYHEVDPVSIIGLMNHYLPDANPWTT